MTRTVSGVATSITAFVGRTLRGPTDRPVIVQSFADFTRLYGGLWLESPLSYAVSHYFLNGGRDALICRVHHAAARASVTLAPGFGLEAANEGAWGNRLRVRVEHAESEADDFPDTRFNLLIKDSPPTTSNPLSTCRQSPRIPGMSPTSLLQNPTWCARREPCPSQGQPGTAVPRRCRPFGRPVKLDSVRFRRQRWPTDHRRRDQPRDPEGPAPRAVAARPCRHRQPDLHPAAHAKSGPRQGDVGDRVGVRRGTARDRAHRRQERVEQSRCGAQWASGDRVPLGQRRDLLPSHQGV